MYYIVFVSSVVLVYYDLFFIFFFKQKTAYEMRISDWRSDVCSSDLPDGLGLSVVSASLSRSRSSPSRRWHLPFASSLLERAPTRGYGYGTSTAGDYLGGATLSAISPDWSRSRTVAGLPATARASPPPRFGGSSSNWPQIGRAHV